MVKYPPLSPTATPNGKRNKVNVTIRPPGPLDGNAASPAKGQKLTGAQALKQRQAINAGLSPGAPLPLRPEEKPDSPEYKKKQAMIKGPVLELTTENINAYDMEECTFTGLKDIFTALIESESRTGVLSPQRFLEIFKRDNEMFRNSMHQDAHEFYGLVLNDIIANVEASARRQQDREELQADEEPTQAVEHVLGAPWLAAARSKPSDASSLGTGWVHDIFEGLLVSETRCLTCETTSQRDETFLDLSIDLEEHSSVTSCLAKFSAEEMLCERNKFHCDHCGGLQEAEKRMKVKKLPKVLALHLKRFKYTEDYSRLQKLFHRVVYPYYLRIFNTTDDAVDQDRMYELYAVVIHIGGNAYHGHYVSVIKTPDRGWLLFDDEMVEPVDKHFVRNFFGDRPGMACAYVLFYQETTFEKMRREQDADGLEEVRLASLRADIALGHERLGGVGGAGLSKTHTAIPTPPISPVDDADALVTLNHALSAPGDVPSAAASASAEPVPPLPEEAPLLASPMKKFERSRAKQELKAAEKARKTAEKEEARRAREARKAQEEELQRAPKESKHAEVKHQADADAAAAQVESAPPSSPSFPGPPPPAPAPVERGERGGLLNRAARGSKSMSRKSFAFLGKVGKDGDRERERDRDRDRGDKGDKMNGSGSLTTDAAARHENGNGNGNGNSSTRSSSQTADRQQQEQLQHPAKPEKHPLRERFTFGIGRKKSQRFQS